MSLSRLKEFCKEVVIKYPSLYDEVKDLYHLCLDEISEGGSETHEIQLCWSSIEELVEELEKKVTG